MLNSASGQMARAARDAVAVDPGFLERLRAAVDGAGGQRALSQETGIPLRTLASYIAGETEPKVSGLRKIASSAGVSVQWLAEGEDRGAGGAEAFVMIPRYNLQASAGAGTFTVGHGDAPRDFLAFRRDWVRQTFHGDPRSLYLLTASGDSMSPTILDEDLLLVDGSVDRMADEAIYVLNYGGSIMLKRLQRLLSGIEIRADNPVYPPLTVKGDELSELRILGRVAWIARRV